MSRGPESRKASVSVEGHRAAGATRPGETAVTTIPPSSPAVEPPPSSESLLTPREIGSTGLRPFPIAFDGSVLGWVTGSDEAAEVLDRFHAAGGNLVSTADHYAAGRSELMVGSWLATVDRDSVIVA